MRAIKWEAIDPRSTETVQYLAADHYRAAALAARMLRGETCPMIEELCDGVWLIRDIRGEEIGQFWIAD